MRRLLFVLMCAALVVLQLSWLPALRPFGVVPDLMLVLVALVALEGTASTAVVLAVAGGVALDLVSGANTGLWTGALVLVALGAGLVHRSGVETAGLLVPGLLVVAGTLVVNMVILIGLVGVVTDWPVWFIARQLGVELVINLGLVVVVRPLVRRLVPPSHEVTVR